jgi:hypothetical protein
MRKRGGGDGGLACRLDGGRGAGWDALIQPRATGCVLLALAAVCLGAPKAKAQDNVLVNGGFETGSLSPCLTWGPDSWTVESPAHGGSAEAWLTAPPDHQNRLIQNFPAVEGGYIAEVSAWVRIDSGDSGAIRFVVVGSHGATIPEMYVFPVDDGVWHKIEVTGLGAIELYYQVCLGVQTSGLFDGFVGAVDDVVVNVIDEPMGAYCFADRRCEITAQRLCPAAWLGEGTACEPKPCPRPGDIDGAGLYRRCGARACPSIQFGPAPRFSSGVPLASARALIAWGSEL